MKVTTIAWDTIDDIEKGDLSKHAVMTLLNALSKEVCFTRAYGSYRDGKAQQKHLINRFWAVLESKLNDNKA